MIREAIKRFYDEYYSSVDFKTWQNDFSDEIYSCLNGAGEVKTVTDLCKVMANKNYKGLRIESRKLHGYSTSGVQFSYKGKIVGTELADMEIISLVTLDRRVVLLKIAFIQNKKATSHKTIEDTWKIDEKQLFLLKNFPTFKFVSGKFKGQETKFLNHSGTLGNYGLFTSNGDMAFLTARNVFRNQNYNGTIHFDTIKRAASQSIAPQILCSITHCEDCFDRIDFRDNNPLRLHCRLCNYPFWGNYNYALDVHEIVKGLTYFNIGEPINVAGRVVNSSLHNYVIKLLADVFGHSLGEDGNYFFNRNRGQFVNEMFEHSHSSNVILNHLELGDDND
jgi:hypothetical protein